MVKKIINSNFFKFDFPSQLNILIAVKLFNCFNVMCQIVNKQGQICGHIFLSK